MARPKSKHVRKTIGITLDERVLKAARFDIDNLSAYVESCLKKHILSILKSPDRAKLIAECGDDILYIMRSSKPDKSLHNRVANELEVMKERESLTDEELDALLEGL